MARLQKKAGGSHHRYEPNIRPSLRDGVTAYTWSPRCALLFGHRRERIITAHLASASGCRDRTISPCASHCSSARNASSNTTRPPHLPSNAR